MTSVWRASDGRCERRRTAGGAMTGAIACVGFAGDARYVSDKRREGP